MNAIENLQQLEDAISSFISDSAKDCVESIEDSAEKIKKALGHQEWEPLYGPNWVTVGIIVGKLKISVKAD